MLANLKNPPEPFEDVIRTHFRLKARSILAQLDDWLSKDDGKSTSSDGGVYSTQMKSDSTTASGSTNGLAKDVDELQRLLKRL